MAEPAAAPTTLAIDRDETDFQQAMRWLIHPAPMERSKTRLLLGSLFAFIAVSVVGGNANPVELATLVGVIFVHELGHMIAMRIVGYRDVRIFFIPFFGGAAAGNKRGVERWKEGLVLLCGPLPGIVAGGVLAYLSSGELARVIALQLIVINALNLLPVAPLDGGQLFQVLLFSRQRHLELVFVGITAALVAFGGVYTESYVLAIVGLFVVVSLPHKKRILDVAHRLRDRGLSSDPALLDEVQQRDLYRASMESLPAEWRTRWRGKPQQQAQMVEQVLERATQRPPSSTATAAQLAIWFAGLVAAFVGLSHAIGPHWRPYTDAANHYSIDMPAEPRAMTQSGLPLMAATVGRDRSYTVIVREVADPAVELQAARHSLSEDVPVTELAGTASDRVLTYREKGFVVMRLVAGPGRFYMILAVAPDDEPDSHRFVTSFRLLP